MHATPEAEWRYWTQAHCSHHRSCHGASHGYNLALVEFPPGFPLAATAEEAIAALRAATPEQRACRWCHRPIATRRFDLRRQRTLAGLYRVERAAIPARGAEPQFSLAYEGPI